MNPQEMDQLVRRANAAGFDSIADYAAELEFDVQRLRVAVRDLVIDVEDFGEPRRHKDAIAAANSAFSKTSRKAA